MFQMHACFSAWCRAGARALGIVLVAASAAATLAAGTALARGVPHKLGEPVFRQMLYFSHTVGPDAKGGLAEGLTGYVAPIASGTGFGAQVAVTQLSQPTLQAMPRMPPVALGTQPAAGYEREFVLRSARTWAQANAARFTEELGSWLAAQKLSGGHYAFTQELEVASAEGPQKRTLYWAAMAGTKGQTLYGNPVLADEQPTFIEVLYVSLAAGEGLPAHWKFESGGQLSWRKLDKNFQPVGDMVTLDVHGAFDTPANAEDPDAALRCLMDERNTGCPNAGVSVRALLVQARASAALVDYVHALEPKYVPAGSCVIDGSTESDCERADVAVRYTERTWSCAGLSNKGAFGFGLTARASRYLAALDEPLVQYQLLTEQVREAISPTESFDRFVARAQVGTTNPDSVLISPFTAAPTLVSRDDAQFARMVVDAGTLHTDSSGGGALALSPSHADLNVAHPASDEYVLSATNTVAPAGVIAPERWVTFYVSDPAAVDVLRLDSLTHQGPIEVSLNGHVVYSGPPALGGGALAMSFMLSTAGISWSDATGYSAAGMSCANIGQGAWCGPVSGGAGTIPVCLVQSCSEAGCYGCAYSGAIAPWAFYSGGCTQTTVSVGEGTYSYARCVSGPPGFAGTGFAIGYGSTGWFAPNGYPGPYSAALNVELKPWLVQGLNTLKIKTAPYAGWGYSVRVRAQGCLQQDPAVTLPAPVPVP